MALLSALEHVANLGQFYEIGIGHAHQREQIRWTKRSFAMDGQALKIDLLGVARDDVRGTYDTYVERLDSLLILNGLLLPFALNTLQFSDQFVPQEEKDCPDCIQSKHPGVETFWVYLVAIGLILPFWSILLLLRSKMKLDKWLQRTLDHLQDVRRNILGDNVGSQQPASVVASTDAKENELAKEQEEVVSMLGNFIVTYQDLFQQLWVSECQPLFAWATFLLWSSAYVAILLTGLMFWIFLKNRAFTGMPDGFVARPDWLHFAVILIVGLLLPVVAFMVYQIKTRQRKISPPEQLVSELLMRGSDSGDSSDAPQAASTSSATAVFLERGQDLVRSISKESLASSSTTFSSSLQGSLSKESLQGLSPRSTLLAAGSTLGPLNEDSTFEEDSRSAPRLEQPMRRSSSYF